MYLWLAVFTLQPHKEERFLFPVYPLLAVAAAISINCLQRLFFRLFVRLQNRHYLDRTNWLSVSALLLAGLLSLSRLVAVHVNYSAPINAWMHLSHLTLQPDFVSPVGSHSEGLDAPAVINVCVGKEWHRFPNSFFLPGDDWQLKYLRSEFRGQLPQPYLKVSLGS